MYVSVWVQVCYGIHMRSLYTCTTLKNKFSQELVLCFHYGFTDSNTDQWALPAEPWIHLVDTCCVMFFTLLGL